MYISLIYQVHTLLNFSQIMPKLRYFPNCKGPGPIPNGLEKNPEVKAKVTVTAVTRCV